MARPILDEILVYPVKGARGLSLPATRVDGFGLHLDRRWVLVDGEGVFLSQRNHPRLALLQPGIEEGALVLEAPDCEPLRLPLEPEGPRIEVRVWGERVEAVEVEGVGRWIEPFLGERARLAYMPGDARRPVDPDYAPDARVSFADAYPVLLLSRESLAELNARLSEPVPMNRFRPNLVVRDAGPHAEDTWRRVRIGEVEFDVVKPCPRCAVTTVDQESGRRGREPLRTLAEYRAHEGKAWFGQNLVQRNRGTLEVGDEVQLQEIGEPRPPMRLAGKGGQVE